ncbi:replication protein A 70 kDa DNA-binding subunit B-like [Helianthus annuus]|uniref:replication protein A 70 kDa DNA-binding subunit B-like n=1 Tax=Helianthus annuus TaxID=4232 RepID=UPI001653005F|nr:replication protein A 70 kDa DNA-binding subunit B-like [Helianthus annuus]
MACKSISSITAGDGAEPIEIRVIRKCLSFVYKEEYCFLFVDREGTAIEAIGSKRDKAFLDAKLVLQSCYRVTNYLSARARQSHNVVPRAATIKLGLGRGTHFTPIDDSAFPTNYFNFLPFNRLRDREGNHFLLTDYIGRFDTITSNGPTKTNKRLMKLLVEDDSENFIEVALWEEVANTVNKEALIQEPFPCIIAITSLKVSEFNYLQMKSTAPTHIYINPDIEEASSLATRFKERYTTISINQRNLVTLRELVEKDPLTNSERKFTCVASIISFTQGRTWYYKGCVKCNKKLTPKSAALACENHPDVEQPKLLYCLCATIADTTGTATVTLFDEAMNSLVQTRCEELIIQQGYTDPYVIPDKIEAFKGVTKTFHLQFNNRPQSGSSQYIVNNVSDHTNIPEEEKNAVTTLTVSEDPQQHMMSTPVSEAATISPITLAEEQNDALPIPPVSDDPQQQTISTPVSKAATISPITPPNMCVHKRQLLNSPDEDSKKMKSANAPKSKQD